MNFAPLGVFGAIAAVIAIKGLGVFSFYGQYLLYFLVGIVIIVGHIVKRWIFDSYEIVFRHC